MEAFHYPPEVLQLLVDTIPLLCRSKDDLLAFFQGAGVEDADLAPHRSQLRSDREGFRKHAVTRALLVRLNERGDSTIRQRREVLRRVCEFEDFSTCWKDDQLKARGLVAQVQHVVNVKDSFTRMRQERDKEQQAHRAERRRQEEANRARQEELVAIRRDLNALFVATDPWKRGKALEGVLTRLFQVASILIREPFALKGNEREGIVEQIDGVVQLDGHLYIVEIKWHTSPIDVVDVSRHLVRVFSREGARALFISASGYTEPAVTTCREALSHRVAVLVDLRELVVMLERDGSLGDLLKAKVQAAVIDRTPFVQPLT